MIFFSVKGKTTINDELENNYFWKLNIMFTPNPFDKIKFLRK